jgi:hypothetical protein
MFGLAAPATKAQTARLLPLAPTTPVYRPHVLVYRCTMHALPHITARRIHHRALAMPGVAPSHASLCDCYHVPSA